MDNFYHYLGMIEIVSKVYITLCHQSAGVLLSRVLRRVDYSSGSVKVKKNTTIMILSV